MITRSAGHGRCRDYGAQSQCSAGLRILPWAKLPKRHKRVHAVDRQEVQIGRHHTRSNLICPSVSSVYLHWRGWQLRHWIPALGRSCKALKWRDWAFKQLEERRGKKNSYKGPGQVTASFMARLSDAWYLISGGAIPYKATCFSCLKRKLYFLC